MNTASHFLSKGYFGPLILCPFSPNGYFNHLEDIGYAFSNGQQVPIGIFASGNSSKWTLRPLTNFT